MSNDLTAAESRLIRTLCTAGPMGISPTGLSKALGLSTTTVINLSVTVERKGFCSRERYGMRIFLRPTPTALAYVADGEVTATPSDNSARPPKPRRPRLPR